MQEALQVIAQIKRDNIIREEERRKMARFFLSTIIDPDGEGAEEWRAHFSLVGKATVRYLESVAGGN